MSDRFFSSTPITADRATLEGPEAHHLAHVMRAAVGQRVTLFDGSGAEYDAVVETIGRSTAELRIVECHEVDRELPFPLVVGVALPKGDRQKWLVEKLTELGVTELVPLLTERGVAQPTVAAIGRLQRVVIEAAKQCGRNRLLQIAKPQACAEWMAAGERGAPATPNTGCLIAHPGGTPLAALDLRTPHATQMAIGPEGGFTDAEITAARAAGWQTIDLGPRTLRVETAAVSLAAAVVMQQTNDQSGSCS